MQGYTNSNSRTVKTIVVFLLILFFAYLPVSTFLFFIKNDAFNGYFPPKFFMSESIHAGYLPMWNPYINFGLPQYGDMSSGFWSPVTWLIASTVGYDAYTFTQEILFYIFLGGIGMYQLCGYWKLDRKIKLLAGVAFMCCGYNVGHLQHFNWISGAGLLPWCMWSYLRLTQKHSLQNLLKAALFFYLFVSSAHPGLLIGALYFFIAVAAFIFFRNERKLTVTKNLIASASGNFLLLALLLLLSTGLITGYLDILPYFSRGQKLLLPDSLHNPTSLQSWLSFILPLSITKNDSFFSTDISMRNVYTGMALAMFFCFSLLQKKDSWQKFLILTGLLFSLLSAGGIFKTLAYHTVPMISYVRLDGEFIIFSLFSFILASAIQLNRCYASKMKFSGKIIWVYYFFEIIIALLILVGIFHTSRTHQSFIYHIHEILSQKTVAEKLKTCIDAITFYDTMWLQGLIQLFILWGIKRSLRNSDYKMMVIIAVVDLCLATLLNLPFTGVGKSSVSQVQAILNKSPHGIVIPALQPPPKPDTLDANNKGLVGEWSMYSKQLGTTTLVPYPILLNSTIRYFDEIEKDSSTGLMNKGFIFTSIPGQATHLGPYADSLKIISFTPGQLKFNLIASNPGQVVYQQNFYPHWFYHDGKGAKKIIPYGTTFMAAPFAEGKNEISFFFNPSKVEAAMVVSLIALVISVLLLVILSFSNARPAKTGY
ncbi:MAG: hypothetical protein ABJA57_07405 [Ginsengibacter sp.]